MIFRCVRVVVCALGIVCLTSSLSYAANHVFDVFLDGLQETPPNASPGTGGGPGVVNYDDATLNLSWNFSFQDLLAPASAAHFHKAPPGVAGPVVVPITVPAATSGVSNGNAAITAAQGADLLAGQWYLNIHTSVFPGGEIRGQVIEQVPEPGTLLLLSMAGISGLFLLRRRLIK